MPTQPRRKVLTKGCRCMFGDVCTCSATAESVMKTMGSPKGEMST